MSLHLFNFADPIPGNYRRTLPAYFQVNAATTYDVLIIRLLTSTIRIVNLKYHRTINISYNNSSYPAHLLTRKSLRPIITLLSPHDISHYITFSRRFYTRNINFYHNILQELTFYFSYNAEKQHLAAFVNLYRTLEYMSYSVPLMHASHFGNYLGSFSALKSYFLDDKTSEVVFFEQFVITKLYHGTAYLGMATTFDFTHPDGVIANNCYDAFLSLMPVRDWLVADRARHVLEVENVKLLSLFKKTRNRYFHFAVGGQRNLHTTDLADPDFFFSRVNDQYISWLAFIYCTVVKENLSNALM